MEAAIPTAAELQKLAFIYAAREAVVMELHVEHLASIISLPPGQHGGGCSLAIGRWPASADGGKDRDERVSAFMCDSELVRKQA